MSSGQGIGTCARGEGKAAVVLACFLHF